MTPVGHCGIALLGACPLRKRVGVGATVLGALAPDLDFALVGFSWFNEIHRVWTHNLAFVLLVAVLGSAFVGRSRGALVFGGLLFGGLLHLAVDACFDGNPTNGVGVALFWPFSSAMISPFNLAATSEGAGWDHPWQALAHAARRGWWELAVLGAGGLACPRLWARWMRSRGDGQPGRQK